MRASAILVHHQSEELLLGLLESLAGGGAERPEEIVVVDNSPPGELETRLGEVGYPVRYLAAPRNLGFAGGVNLGLGACDREIVILLNPDARPEPDCLAGLVSLLESRPDTGIAGPALVPMDDSTPRHPSATRIDPTLRTTLLEHTILHRVARGWLNRHYFVPPEVRGAPRECAMVQGACLALRRRLVEAIGGFDDRRFFHFWEETDYCRRARQAGWKVLYAPDLRCRHLGGGSTPDPALARRHFWRGLLAYHRKHGGPLRAALLRALLVPGVAAEWLLLAALRVGRPGDAVLERDLEEMGGRLRVLLRPDAAGFPP